jgi:hypothetical protein
MNIFKILINLLVLYNSRLMNEIIAYTLTGVASGSFAGLIGAGAEILVVPLLTIFGVLGSLKNS